MSYTHTELPTGIKGHTGSTSFDFDMKYFNATHKRLIKTNKIIP